MTTTSAAAAPRILIAEDDASLRRVLEDILTGAGYDVTTAEDGLAAMARLSEPFAAIVTDLRMPRADGIEVLRFARGRWPTTPVILLTAFGTIDGAVQAMRLGAFDYLAKPLPDPEALRAVVRRALSAGPVRQGPPLVVADPAMQAIVAVAERAAREQITVLLLGESGVGKEVIARLVHDRSARAHGPFVALNCAAMPEALLESELFGHERGAFTGAVARREGRFLQAHGGTLFLDEIGETSAAMQAKLLRVLQEKKLTRVGGHETLDVDARVVAATNRRLLEDVRAGLFREDLYYRLAAFPIEIPPLRRRPADILALARHFLHLLTRGPDRTLPILSEGAQQALQRHDWPGNVRELQNAIERALVLSGGETITEEMLLPSRAGSAPSPTPPVAAPQTLRALEREAILAALEAEAGNRKRTAERLGIALRTLQYKLKEYGLS